jgi:hypothetical protein
MPEHKRLGCCLAALAAVLGLTLLLSPAQAYVEAPYTLGRIIAESTGAVVLMRVEKVDKQNNIVFYRKVADLKNKHPTDQIIHNIGKGGLRPNEWKQVMDWAEPGKLAVFFHNGGASETCIGTWWYQCYGGGQNWNHVHGEPYLLRSYAGNVEKLAAAVTAIHGGQEVIVPCMVNGNLEDLHQRKAKIQRLKASLKLMDYNPKRDFVGWGGEDYQRLNGVAGFTHYAGLTRVDPDAQCISCADIDGDGKMDLCLIGAGKLVVLLNSGESLSEIPLPGAVGVRSAVWADYNGDGRPDLLLATVAGAKLFTNLGNNTFRDDSNLLPAEPYNTLTAAAWIDYDRDGKPDILLANGYHGLRLYRNVAPAKGPAPAKMTLGKWYYLGPFDNTGGNGFNATHPVEKNVDLAKEWTGKNGVKTTWKEGKFADGQVCNLLDLFPPAYRSWSAVYLYREIEASEDMALPVSLGSDDTLTVWLNGEKVLAQNVYRACGPDQDHVTLKLKGGKNQLLLKICQGDGDWAFFFAAGMIEQPSPKGKWFEDVSDQVGLGANSVASKFKGDTLAICDVDGDGRPDFLYGAGTGMLFMNTPKGFVLREDSGIVYKTGKVGPVFGDFDNDGHPDLIVPQKNGVKLFRNDGKGRFTDVTAKAGDLAKFNGWATSAAWGDLHNNGHLDLVIGCLHGPNRFYRNKGDGTFEDVTPKLGLQQRTFNTQAVALIDINNDGLLDVVFNNAGQEPCIFLTDPGLAGKRLPVMLTIAGKDGVIGSEVGVFDQQGKLIAKQQISGGDGRGGQAPPQARFALDPGTYRVVVRYSSGVVRAQMITVAAGTPFRGMIDEKTPKME